MIEDIKHKHTKTNNKKKTLLKALEKTNGIVSTACKLAKVSRYTFYKYYNEDKEFKNNVDDVGELALDFAESGLFKLIKGGDKTAIIFYLKTKGRKRGYIERQEIRFPNKTDDDITPFTFYKTNDKDKRKV